MKTRDRILLTALEAFSARGVAGVSTNQIADEMEISPGNLHYHFNSKAELIKALYLCFNQDILSYTRTSERPVRTPQELWLLLALSFQLLAKYRFVFRDASYVLNRYPELRRPFATLLRQTRESSQRFCRGLVASGILDADSDTQEALAQGLHLQITQWVGYADLLQLGRVTHQDEQDPFALVEGINQVLHRLHPYLRPEVREAFTKPVPAEVIKEAI
ncbi:TetR/AcrR family transcriptional regulator [Ferrimonas marina]|uniref:Transcriptional regulator, TetR family n=1 Tax=Ferrimonas marina TaxID=299255 RepID=A0A1M5X3G2_9GAMM|nr:TetR/AcrR family transcriptional regulator [Ferrimonas marina]SHH94377.1 transcriptional regulator, TetR family [Ferrimonas marina]